MTNINLLPWREQLKEDRKREFFVALGVVVAIAAGLLFMVDRYINAGINNQKALNDYLDEQIVILDSELTEIRDLRSQKAVLTERMGVIQDLQGTRPIIVRLFDELVRTLPEDVYYSRVSRTENSIRLEGIAGSHSLFSELMRQLDASEWFSGPDLDQVTAAPSDDITNVQESTRNTFQLNVAVTTPEPEQ